MSTTGDTLAVAATTAGQPHVGALVKIADSILSLFGKRKLTTWQERNDFALQVTAQMLKQLEQSNSPQKLLAFLEAGKKRFLYLISKSGFIHPTDDWQRKAQYSSDVERMESLHFLIWDCIMYIFDNSPDFSSYEVGRRFEILFREVFSPAAAASGVLLPGVAIAGAPGASAPGSGSGTAQGPGASGSGSGLSYSAAGFNWLAVAAVAGAVFWLWRKA